MLSLLPCTVQGSPMRVQGGATMSPSCSHMHPTFLKHANPDSDIDPHYYTMEFPCGFDLPTGAKIHYVEVKTDDDACIHQTGNFEQEITLTSLSCQNSCATQPLSVEVKYVVNNMPSIKTFTFTDTGERAKVCGLTDSSLETPRQAMDFSSEIAAIRHHEADMFAKIQDQDRRMNELEEKLKQKKRHLHHMVKRILNWELRAKKHGRHQV